MTAKLIGSSAGAIEEHFFGYMAAVRSYILHIFLNYIFLILRTVNIPI